MLGIVIVWFVGMGRYWDNPRVGLLQHLGVGSVIYVFVLSAVLWAVVWPFRETGWSYARVLTLVVLTSPPAAIYAIPVEQWSTVAQAGHVNLWFVVIVSIWRMLMWGLFVSRMTSSATPVFTVTFLPVILIIFVLSILNLEHAVVWQLMGGIHEEPTPADFAYNVVSFIAVISTFLALPVFLIIYGLSYWSLRESRTTQSTLSQAAKPIESRESDSDHMDAQ